jgi:two-component system, sensor histidine kinase RpfC
MRSHPLLSLKYRIAACIFVLEAVMMFLVLGQTLRFSDENTRAQLADNETVILDIFAGLSQNALLTKDLGDLQEYAEKLTRDARILKVLVGDRGRRIVVSTDLSDLGKAFPAQFSDTPERFWRTKTMGNLGMIAVEFSNRELIEATRLATRRAITIALIAMVVIAVTGIAFGFLLTRRLETVTDAAARLGSGDLSVRTSFAGRDELSVVGRTFDRMAARIQRDILVLEDSQRALVQARDELEIRVAERTSELKAASEAKSEFLATMSHELRTPLNSVVGAAELLAARELPGAARQLVEWLLASSRQLRSLVDDLLDMRRIEAGKMTIDRAPFDLRTLMKRLATLFEPQARRAGLRFTDSIAADVPCLLIGDDVRIQQVLINLTANALKFTSEGQICVSAGVAAQSGAEVTLRFEVRDTGIGIAPEDAARIFDRFTQANAGIRRRYGGSGLGTTICKHLVELMGGTIGFDSEPGKGTVFQFTVPLVRQPADSCGAAKGAPAERQIAGTCGLRVLVAEDHAMSRQIIAMMLEAGGHHVTQVGDGDAVIEQLRSVSFDVVMLDMHMPGSTGLEVARAIRALEARGGNRRTPIVMLTAVASADLREESLAAGIDIFLSKPVDSGELLHGVSQAVSGVRDAGAPAAQPAPQDYVDRGWLRDVARISRDPGFAAAWSARCTREAQRLVDEIEAALSRGDLGRSRELAHVLKGAAAMMGADRLRHCAGRLEALSGPDLTDTGAHVLLDLKATLHATSDELVRAT